MPRTALHSRRTRTSCSILALATVMAVGATPAAAQSFLGTGTYTTNANATGITTAPNLTTINLNGGQTVIDWVPTDNAMGGGNITFQNAGTTALFTSSSDFAVLNRINPADTGRAIVMNGTVNSRVGGVQRGSVYFYSPGGFIFGGSSVFSVGSLVVTTSPITLTGNNFINGTENTVVFGQALNPNAFISSNGTISATSAGFGVLPPGNSYVAMVAPRVTHSGSITVNGSAALVAAEAATINFSPDGLFDIQVTVGTDDDNGVQVFGDIGGPAPASGTDRQGVYLVAVPKNDALTMVIGNGADLGFTLANEATRDAAGVVVLSAGHDITDGAIGAKSAAPGTGLADFWFTGAHATNNLFGEATGNAFLYSVSPNLTTTFDRNVTVHAAGNVSMSSSGAGASLTVGGNLSLSADHTGTAGQSVTAGNVNLFTQNGGTLSVVGTIDLSADAVGGDASSASAGNGTGGNVTVSANDGSTLTINSLTTSATGTGGSGLAAGVNAGNGTGGTLSIDASNGGNVVINSPLVLNAQGYGGSASGAGLAGNGTGGVARIYAGANATMTFNDAVTLDSSGFGGSHGTGTGGTGTGGWAIAHAAGGTIDVDGNLLASADGEGGSAEGGQGGDGFGTNAEIFATLGGIVTIGGNVALSVTGTGGDGSVGGDGTGGGVPDGEGGGTDGAHIFAKNGSVTVSGVTTLDASGSGGDGANGGAGGDAQGGWATIHARNTNDGSSSITLATANIRADATGGDGGQGTSGNLGGDGGTGGSATGGVVSITANAGNGHITATTLNATAIATGGAGGDGGNGDGLAGGNGGDGGDAEGGSVTVGTSSGGNGESLASNLGTATFTTINMDASATGGTGGAGNFGSPDGSGGDGGTGDGGAATLLVRGSTVTVTGTTQIVANGTGGNGGSGGGELGAQGEGGDGFAGEVGVLSTSRFLIPAQRGTLNAGAILGTATGTGGLGSTDGDGIVEGGSGFVVDRSTVNIGSLDFDISGDFVAEGADPSRIAITNATVDVDTTFDFSTIGDLTFYIDQGSLTAGTIALTAGNFVTDGELPTPVNRGTAFADTVLINSNGDFIADADFDVTNTFVVNVPGSIRVGNVSDDNGIDFTAGGSMSIDGVEAGTYLNLFAVEDLDTDDILAGSFVDIESETGSIGIGNIGAGGSVSLVAGTFIAGEDISAGGSIFAQTFDGDIGLEDLASSFGSIALIADGDINLSGDLLADGDIELTATGLIDMNHATAGESVDLQAGGNILALNLTAGDSVVVEADGSATVGNLSAGLVDPSTNEGADHAVAIHAAGNILTGNIAAAQDVSLATPGTITTGDINAGGTFLALGHGDMSFGDAVADEVFLADYAMFGAGQISATCVGACGTLGADGVVTAPPSGSSYFYVTTDGGVGGAGQLDGEGGTNGSLYTTSPFAAEAGDDLSFWFNYVTSDGSGFADYAWAALFTTSFELVAVLYTARTQPTGTIVPGLGLPGVEATLNPSSVPIIGGAPVWDPLGASSGTCYSAGCGYTGWVSSTYDIANSGTYVLRFGTSNWLDTSYQSGMAFSGITVGGTPVTSAPVRTGGSITIGNVNTGSFTAAAGTSLTTGIIDSSGGIGLDAGGAITTANLFAGTFLLANGGSIVTGNIQADSVDVTSTGGNIATGNILAFSEVELNSFGDITTGDIRAGSIDLIAGDDITTGDLTTQSLTQLAQEGPITTFLYPGASITLDAGGDIATGNIDSIDGVYANAGGSITTGWIEANDFVELIAGDDISSGYIDAGQYILAESGGDQSLGNLDAGWDIDLEAGGNLAFGDAVAGTEFDFEAGGNVTGGDIVAGIEIGGEGAGGSVTLGDLTAGFGEGETEDVASIGISAGGSITVGNVNGALTVGFATLGNLTTGNIQAGDDFLALASGNIITGSITTGEGDQVYMAHSSMCVTGGGCSDAETDFDPEIVFALDPVATGGSITINGPVSTGSFDAAAGTGLTTQAMNVAGDIHASAGGTATLNGVWNSGGDVSLASNDIDISNTGGINAADSVGLYSTNATQALIGDGLTGTGYQLSNAEFGRISGHDVGIGARGDATAAIDMLIGDLTATALLSGSTIEGSDGILAFGVGDIDSETVSGVIRVAGDVGATGFGSGNAIEFHADRFELDAANGSVSIVSSGSTLAGEIGLYADRIHVAEAPILDQLAANPTYSGYQQDLNEAATVQRPEGVLRADTLWVESDNLQSVLIQNTGTAETPAGFLVRQAFVNEDQEVAGPPGSINLVVNGQVVTEGGTLTGVEARDALIDEETDVTPFTSNSTINGCPLTGACMIAPPPPPPTGNVVDNQIDLINGNPFGEGEFDDNQEGEEGSSNPISPPQPLFDTRPLIPASDVNDPVSGTGNPALLGASECVEDDDEAKCGTEKETGQ